MKFINTLKRTTDQQLIKNCRTVPYLISFYSTLPSASVKSVGKQSTNTTPWHVPPTPRRKSEIVRLLYYNCFFPYADPLAKTHGYPWMPSTPRVRNRSLRYIIFPAQRVMPAKWTKIHHSTHGPGCDSLHTRTTRNTRAWTYARRGPLLFGASLAV